MGFLLFLLHNNASLTAKSNFSISVYSSPILCFLLFNVQSITECYFHKVKLKYHSSAKLL